MRSNRSNQRLLAAALSLMLAGGAALAASAPAPAPKTSAAAADDKHRQQDIAQHRQMASAHLDAASCLESGQPEETCQQQLRKACQGIAVGKYCGMRHRH